MKARILTLWLLALVALTAYSQERDLRKEFDGFTQAIKVEYGEFSKQSNVEFAEFLKQVWMEFEEKEAINPPLAPVPETPVICTEPTIPVELPLTRPDVQPESGLVTAIAPTDRSSGMDNSLPRPNKPSAASKPAVSVRPTKAVQPITPNNTITPVPDKPSATAKPTKPTVNIRPETTGTVTGTAGEASTTLPAGSIVSAVLFPEQLSLSSIKESLNFYGVECNFFGVRANNAITLRDISENGIANGWNKLTNSDIPLLIPQMSSLGKQMSLNDWGYYELAKAISEKVFPKSTSSNERILTQAFLLNNLGYKSRISRQGENLALLLPLKERIYGNTYLTLENGTRYYIFRYNKSRSGNLATYNGQLPSANRTMSVDFQNQPLQFKEEKRPQARWTEILGQPTTFSISDSKIKFLLNYPLCDLTLYHRASVSTKLQTEVFDIVREKTHAMDQQKAVQYILNLVQFGFEYKTDEAMFGRQKPLFIEESFYYGQNNCKDRVAVFSWLIKGILGLETVMFDYPNHVACGVNFTQEAPTGDYYQHKGKRFTMCDPTYIGASVGMTMNAYKNISAEIIEL